MILIGFLFEAILVGLAGAAVGFLVLWLTGVVTISVRVRINRNRTGEDPIEDADGDTKL